MISPTFTLSFIVITLVTTTTISMSSNNSIILELLPLIRLYRDGQFERLSSNHVLLPSFDSKTGVVSKDVIIDSIVGISARLFLPIVSSNLLYEKLPVLVYFHGGAFLVESAFSETYHPHLNNLASLAPLIGVSVNYRLAPEYPLPAAYEDAWAAINWVFARADPWLAELGDFDRVYVAGDSAGANIAHQMAMRSGVEGVGVIKGIALVHAYFWGEKRIGAERTDRELRSNMEGIWRVICPETSGLDDPRIDPVGEKAPSLAGLGCARVLVAVAGKDLLWSRGKLYYEALRMSGWQGEAILIDMPEVGHDFHIFHPETKQAFALTNALAQFFGEDD